MFGLFKKKNLKFKCPMCYGGLGAKLDPSETTGAFEFNKDFHILSDGACPFCKVKFEITINADSRKIKAFDPKWAKVVYDFDTKERALQDEEGDLIDLIDELEDVIGEDNSSATEKAKVSKQITSVKKKLIANENKTEKLQNSFYAKEERYEERQMNWQMKYDEKYG